MEEYTVNQALISIYSGKKVTISEILSPTRFQGVWGDKSFGEYDFADFFVPKENTADLLNQVANLADALMRSEHKAKTAQVRIAELEAILKDTEQFAITTASSSNTSELQDALTMIAERARVATAPASNDNGAA